MSKLVSSARARTSVKACAVFIVTAAMAASSSGMLRGSIPNVATGTWTPTGTMSASRSGAASVLMPDGTVLVTGGSDGTVSVNEVQSYGTTGAFSAGAAMNEARADHTAVLLGDGSVLVAGGRSGSSAVASAEILINGQWFAAGALSDARWGHTATLLNDGRVLVAGGENGSGPLASIEIFDPATGQISAAGALATARKGHAAARLADGRVIVAGGEDFNGVLNSTEIVDASSSSISPGPALGSKRTGLTATTLLDGKVLFLGGSNGTSNLASAEWFTPSTGVITATTSAAVARRDHQAFLLPNNNSVLIVGGIADTTVNGVTTTAPTAAAELFLPWLPAVWQTAPMSAARVNGTGAALSTETYGPAAAADGLLMVAGGEGVSDSEAYRFATIRTDKNDYAPGDVVLVSAAGWQPGETVTFDVRELPAEHTARSFSLPADQGGNINDVQLFTVEPHHLNVRFFLTARGAASQAQVSFTDGNVRARTHQNTYTYRVDWTEHSGGSCANAPLATGNQPIVGFSGGAMFNRGVASANSIILKAANFANDGRVFVAWSGETSSDTFIQLPAASDICVPGNFTGNRTYVATYSSTVGTTLTLAVPSPQSVAFGASGPVTFTATLTRSFNGTPVGGATIHFSVDSLQVGTATTNTSGVATFTTYNPSALTAGAHNVIAVYPGSSSLSVATSNTTVLSVNQANQTINFAPLGNKTYGDAQFTLSATGGASGNPVMFATGGGSAGCSLSGVNNSTVTITGATIGNPCIIVASQAGNTNYNPAPDETRAFSISKATLSVSADNASRDYGDANPSFTATYAGFVNGETLATSGVTGAPSLTTSTTPTSSVAGNPYVITAAIGTLAANNYGFTFVSGQLTINKVGLTVSADDTSRFYGDANPSFTASYSGFKNGETPATSGVSGSPSLTSAANGASSVAGSPYAITAALGTLTAVNYSFTFADGKLTVNRAPLSATAADAARFYGDANPTFTGTLTGVKNGEAIVATYASAATVTTGVGVYGPDDPLEITASVVATPTTLLDNYVVTTTDGTLTINRRLATVKANDKSRFYGDANPAFDATVAGTANGDTLDYTLATAADQTTGVGSYPITVALGANPNYDITPTDGSLTINRRLATVKANDKSRFYGDVNPAFDATVAGTANGDTLDYTLATAADQTTGVGSYPIAVTLGTNANYDITPTDGSLTINRRAATVTANNKSKTYGDDNPVLDAAVTGTTNGDGLNYTLATTAVKFSNAGSYPITVSLGSNPNYDVSPTDGTLLVSRKAASVAANDKAKTYGDDNPALDALVGGTVNGDTLNYTLSTTAVQFSSVGTYPISVALGTNANYDVTPTDGTLTIGRKSASVTADNKSKTYGDNNPTLTAIAAGTVNGDTLSYTLATTAVQFSGVGSYPITVSLGTNPNYDVGKTNAALSVTPKAASVTASNKTREYGAANPALTASVAGTVNNDTLNYSLATTATTASDVGPYPITVTLGTNPNYTVAPTDGILTITRKALTIKANDATKVLGAALTFAGTEFSSTGLVNGDTITSVTLTSTGAAVPAGVGSYPIVPSAAAGAKAGNYDVAYVNGTLKVQFLWDGFLQPINDTAHDQHTTSPVSRFKSGQTIPAKFDLKNANGIVVTQTGSPTFNYARIGGACDSFTEPEVLDMVFQPSAMPVYTLQDGHYQYNWSTKGLAIGLYEIYANLADGTSRSVYICLNK